MPYIYLCDSFDIIFTQVLRFFFQKHIMDTIAQTKSLLLTEGRLQLYASSPEDLVVRGEEGVKTANKKRLDYFESFIILSS